MANLILQQGLSFVRYQADGTTNAYGIAFTYLTPSDIHVFKNGDEVTYSYINPNEIALDTPASADDNIVLNRSVKSDSRYVDFQNGGQIRAQTLDLDSDQIFMMAQEAIDTAGLNLFVSPVTGTIDMKGSRVINVGDPIDDTDAMTFGSSKTAVATATTKASEAAASAAAALVSKNQAGVYMDASILNANVASTARVDAETAQASAELAQSSAEAAQSSAEYYKNLAEAASATATAQAGIATNAGNDASDAADLAVLAKNDAEAAVASIAGYASTASAAATAAEGFRDEAEDFAQAASASIGVPAGGSVKYRGVNLPLGYLWEDGKSYLASAYPNLAAALWNATDGVYEYGGSGTYPSGSFNVPDARGVVDRNWMPVVNVTGTGSVSSNNATFTNHKLNRTGFKIRLTSNSITGLSNALTYYAIVIDDNTIAFATTYANALANIKISISGTNTSVLNQWESPDHSSRLKAAVGGSTTEGTRQDDENKSHTHNYNLGGGSVNAGVYLQRVNGFVSADPTYTSGGNEARMTNISTKSIIKF